jgi:hypothetical protein
MLKLRSDIIIKLERECSTSDISLNRDVERPFRSLVEESIGLAFEEVYDMQDRKEIDKLKDELINFLQEKINKWAEFTHNFMEKEEKSKAVI